MTKILITGANGFIGRALQAALEKNDCQIFAQVRHKNYKKGGKIEHVVFDMESFSECDLDQLKGIEVVIHLAARAHVMHDKTDSPLDEYRKINRDATLKLARQLAGRGVQRFIYISSIKVNGESTSDGECFRAEISNPPSDPYGLSKYEAEEGLYNVAKETGMEVVVIRPPLVYGPGVKANFASIINLVRKGVPIPLGGIQNKRSMVAIDNLVDFILLCIDREKSCQASNETFLISDGEDVSTSTLFQKIAKAYNVKSRLFGVPTLLMKFGARLLGKEDIFDRLFGSLQINNSKARDLLGWEPIVTMDEQLKKMAKYDMDRGGK